MQQTPLDIVHYQYCKACVSCARSIAMHFEAFFSMNSIIPGSKRSFCDNNGIYIRSRAYLLFLSFFLSFSQLAMKIARKFKSFHIKIALYHDINSYTLFGAIERIPLNINDDDSNKTNRNGNLFNKRIRFCAFS